MRGYIIMVYIQEYHSDSEKIINDSKFQCWLFVIYKLMSSCIIWFYVYKSLYLYHRWLETIHINNQKILHFSIYGQKHSLKMLVIQVQSIKLMNIWVKDLVPYP